MDRFASRRHGCYGEGMKYAGAPRMGPTTSHVTRNSEPFRRPVLAVLGRRERVARRIRLPFARASPGILAPLPARDALRIRPVAAQRRFGAAPRKGVLWEVDLCTN